MSKIIVWDLSIFKWLGTMIVSVSITAFISANVFSMSIINGNSMYPTIKNGEIYLVDRINKEPKHGDIVLIQLSSKTSNIEHIVKRVIAKGGEKITIDYDTNNVYLNDEIINEPYINLEETDPMKTSQSIRTIEYVIPAGYLFVMGDNRNHSADSRSIGIGLISEDEVIGKIVMS